MSLGSASDVKPRASLANLTVEAHLAQSTRPPKLAADSVMTKVEANALWSKKKRRGQQGCV